MKVKSSKTSKTTTQVIPWTEIPSDYVVNYILPYAVGINPNIIWLLLMMHKSDSEFFQLKPYHYQLVFDPKILRRILIKKLLPRLNSLSCNEIIKRHINFILNVQGAKDIDALGRTMLFKLNTPPVDNYKIERITRLITNLYHDNTMMAIALAALKAKWQGNTELRKIFMNNYYKIAEARITSSIYYVLNGSEVASMRVLAEAVGTKTVYDKILIWINHKNPRIQLLGYKVLAVVSPLFSEQMANKAFEECLPFINENIPNFEWTDDKQFMEMLGNKDNAEEDNAEVIRLASKTLKHIALKLNKNNKEKVLERFEEIHYLNLETDDDFTRRRAVLNTCHILCCITPGLNDDQIKLLYASSSQWGLQTNNNSDMIAKVRMWFYDLRELMSLTYPTKQQIQKAGLSKKVSFELLERFMLGITDTNNESVRHYVIGGEYIKLAAELFCEHIDEFSEEQKKELFAVLLKEMAGHSSQNWMELSFKTFIPIFNKGCLPEKVVDRIAQEFPYHIESLDQWPEFFYAMFNGFNQNHRREILDTIIKHYGTTRSEAGSYHGSGVIANRSQCKVVSKNIGIIRLLSDEQEKKLQTQKKKHVSKETKPDLSNTEEFKQFQADVESLIDKNVFKEIKAMLDYGTKKQDDRSGAEKQDDKKCVFM